MCKKSLDLVVIIKVNKLKKTRSTGPQKLRFFTPLTITIGFNVKLNVEKSKERPNRSTNKRTMAVRAIRYVNREGVSDTLVKEMLRF